MKKILSIVIFFLFLLPMTPRFVHTSSSSAVAQKYGNENKCYDDYFKEWYFSSLPCGVEPCVSPCPNCDGSFGCDELDSHKAVCGNGDEDYTCSWCGNHFTSYDEYAQHQMTCGVDDSSGNNGVGGSNGSGGSSGGGGYNGYSGSGSSTSNTGGMLPNVFAWQTDPTKYHIPQKNEVNLKYKGGYLPVKYPGQSCDNNCVTTCMEYAYNYIYGKLDDTTMSLRGYFETLYYELYKKDVCYNGVLLNKMMGFLLNSGFDVSELNVNSSGYSKNVMGAIANNHLVLATIVGRGATNVNSPLHEVVVVGYHHSLGTLESYECIDPSDGSIRNILPSQIKGSHEIKGYDKR